MNIINLKIMKRIVESRKKELYLKHWLDQLHSLQFLTPVATHFSMVSSAFPAGCHVEQFYKVENQILVEYKII